MAERRQNIGNLDRSYPSALRPVLVSSYAGLFATCGEAISSHSSIPTNHTRTLVQAIRKADPSGNRPIVAFDQFLRLDAMIWLYLVA
jgi:hypothetical protein